MAARPFSSFCHQDPEALAESCALQHYAGQGAAQLLAWDGDQAALLLEACLPGTPLNQPEDEAQETRIAAQLMRQL
ncbi:MAG: hypothetical protein IGS03_08670 [Candidatus Sericytochromatia bacterium]|nr:hypothetical protein [Candidatus Sericytochromatia bacterium]